MKNIILLILIIMSAGTSVDAQFGDLIKKATKTILGTEDNSDVGAGLKEALRAGVDDAISSLSQQNGYLESPYKILIPEDAQKVISTLSKVPGFQNVERDLISKMNAAAEIAVKKGGPIFLSAIRQMTFKDAMNILMGEPDAATRYLDRTSRTALYEEFMPVIQNALDEVNAREYWSSAVEVYNKIPFKKDLNPQLDDHVNQKTLDGVFALIQVKEEGIRNDTKLRTNPLLQKVFALQDK